MSICKWANSKGFAQGVFWSILTCFISVCNDVVTKYIGERIDVFEISFFRFFFGACTLIPFMILKGKGAFVTRNASVHFYRSLIGVTAVSLFIYGIVFLPLPEMTIYSFVQPLIFLPLAGLFLKEKVGKNKWITVVLGFIGIIVITKPGFSGFSIYMLFPIGSVFFFALLDIIAKKMVSKEHWITIVFYFSLGATALSFIPMLFVWKTPFLNELILLVILGIGATLIQITLLKALASTQASALSHFRYFELVFSVIFGVLLFNEFLETRAIIGAGIIIMSTFYLSFTENIRSKKKKTRRFKLRLRNVEVQLAYKP